MIEINLHVLHNEDLKQNLHYKIGGMCYEVNAFQVGNKLIFFVGRSHLFSCLAKHSHF
jgi:hypothetical protein